MTFPFSQLTNSIGLKSIATKCFTTGLMLALVQAPVAAQSNDQQVRDKIAPGITARELASIREAPYSKIFSSTSASGAPTFGLKDRDYNPGESKMGVFTLWADVPESEFFGVLVRYCVPDTSIAQDGAYLSEMSLIDNGETLLSLTANSAATVAKSEEVQAAQQVVYSDPFYDPYFSSWGGYSRRSRNFYRRSWYRPTIAEYIPAVNCSSGGNRFDLSEVKNEIRRLPEKTLQMKMLFSNGVVENWQLGKGTIAEMKKLPTLIRR